MSEPTRIPAADAVTPAKPVIPINGVAGLPMTRPRAQDSGGDGDPFPDDIAFPGEPLQPLSDRDRDFILDLIENPPGPNDALRKAAAEYRKHHG